MPMDIQAFTAQELYNWVQSDSYQKLSVVPISPQRALSYLHNPRGLVQDKVCFIAREGEEIIGFRTILADHIPTSSQALRFGWLSGVWVAPSHRRLGIASRLLESVLESWEYRLMTSNNSPASRSVYLGSGHFQTYHVQKGQRLYTRFDLAHLLPPRHRFFQRSADILGLADRLGNTLQNARWRNLKKGTLAVDSFTLNIEKLDPVWEEFLGKEAANNLSQRGIAELTWFLSYPWVWETPEGGVTHPPYPFSSASHKYRCLPIGILDTFGKPEAFLVVSLIGSKMIIPYFFSRSQEIQVPGWEEKIYRLVLGMLVKHKITQLTIYHPNLHPIMDKWNEHSLYRKTFEQVYLATKELLPYLPDPQKVWFQDGEGDFGFTG